MSFGVELENSVKIWTYNRLRSSKDDDFGANRKGICDFLLVINSNFGPILHRFRYTANYWLQIAYFACPVLFGTPFPIFPLEFHGAVKRQETSHGATLWWRLRDPNFNLFDRSTVWQTGRQTSVRWWVFGLAYTRTQFFVTRRSRFIVFIVLVSVPWTWLGSWFSTLASYSHSN